MRTLTTIVLGTVALGTALPAAAQSLSDRIARAPAGRTIRFEYAARPGVCGDGENIILSSEPPVVIDRQDGRRTVQTERGRTTIRGECRPGPVRIELEGGRVPSALRARVGATDSPADATDLGTVEPAEAVAYLLEAARRAQGSAAENAVFAATLGRGVEPWRELLQLARDGNAGTRARRSAVFWVGQAAEERATDGLRALVDDDDVDLEAREAAVFALSQRPNDETVPALIEIVRTSPHPQLRRSAIFWLGQKEDARVLAFFEEILLRD